MKILRLYIPFYNRLADTELANGQKGCHQGEDVIIKYKEKDDDHEDEFVAKIVAVIEPGDIKVTIDKGLKLLRCITESDKKKIEDNNKEQDMFFDMYTKDVAAVKLDMVPVECKNSFSGRTVLFTFTALQRIDFRELLKSLAGKIRRKIQLRHIGSRDRAAMLGGHGVCGRELCCSKFLRVLPSVKTDIIKEQEFSFKTADNLSGVCGKLKCCLTYEIEQYREMKKGMPKLGKQIKVGNKKGVVIGLDIFNQRVKVRFEDNIEIIDLFDIKNF